MTNPTELERMASQIGPAKTTIQDVELVKRRIARRRRSAVYVLTSAVVAGTAFLVVPYLNLSRESAPDSGSINASSPAQVGSSTSPCTDSTGDGKEANVSPSSGPSGSTAVVTLSIPTTNELGYVAPEGVVEIWWNAEPEEWPTLLPGGEEPQAAIPGAGPPQLLASVDIDGKCALEASVVIPNAEAGTYYLMAINVREGGASPILPAEEALTFTVV